MRTHALIAGLIAAATLCAAAPAAALAAPDLTITKSDGGATATPGGTVSYTLSYSNAGNQGATGVVLYETVPAGTTFDAGASTAGWVSTSNGSAGSLVTRTVGSLGAGANGSATFAVTVDSTAPAGRDQLSNTASIADDGANGADATPFDNAGSDTTPLAAAPDLVVTVTDGVTSAAPGVGLTYSVGVNNAGTQDASGVVLTEHLPPGTAFDALNSDPGWTDQGGGVYTLPLGSLPALSAGSFSFAVTVDSAATAGREQIANMVEIADDAANGADPAPNDNSATDTDALAAAPDLTLSSSDGRTAVARGDSLEYVLTYANAGTQIAAGVVITEQLPPGTSYDAAQSSPGWTAQGGGAYTLALGSVSPGAAAGTRKFAVRVNGSAPASQTAIENTASIADDGTSGPDLNPTDNSTTDSNSLSAPPPADTDPPAIDIAKPAAGERFVQGARAAATYACTDAASALASCSGPVRAGAAVDTRTLGAHSFTVDAADAAGNRGSRSVTYTVISPGTITRKRSARAVDAGGSITIDTGFVAACPQTGPACRGLLKARAVIPRSQLHGSAVSLKRFGHARIAVNGGDSARVRFKLSRTRAAFLRRVGRVKLRLTAVVRRADGKLVTGGRTVTIRLKKPSLRS